MGPQIRPARPSELSLLRDIEMDADERFAAIGFGPFQDDDSVTHLMQAAAVMVANDPPVGFATVEIADGLAHLWQVSVRPSSERQGIGTALVTAACDWATSEGYAGMTLTTYRDVPWNGPFYRRLGFRTLTHLTPELRAIREQEIALGDDDFGPRIAMIWRRQESRRP
jgi:GNAT superfamily N-acetyltransferase